MTHPYKTSTNSPGMRRVVEALEKHGPLGRKDLADKACISVSTLDNYRRDLLSEGMMHIHDWVRHPRQGPLPVYAAGPQIGRPKEKPPQLTRSVYCKRWKDKTGYDSARKAERRIHNPKDPILLALMGVRRES